MARVLGHARVETRNAMGWSSTVLNEVSALFVKECRARKGQVLDIGAALGIATLAALEAGASVAANDSDATHLASIGEAAPPEQRDRLTLLPGRFPRGVDLAKDSLDAVHASNVLHFFTGRQLELSVEKMHWALRPGGLVFAVAATPYLAPFVGFLAEYKAKVARGERWPGWVENTRAVSKHRLLDRLPKSIHLLDDMVLARAFVAEGFVVDRCWMFRRADLPASLHSDGRESVGLIARKAVS